MNAQRPNRLGRLALVAAVLFLACTGCDSTGGSSTVLVQNKDDLESREQTIKEIYKAKKPVSTKKSR